MNSPRALSALLAATLMVAFPLASHAQSPELKGLQVQYNNDLIDHVTDVYKAGVGKLDAGYLAGVERSLAEATAAGNLEDVLSLKKEVTRLSNKEALPANDEQASKALRKLRTIYRVELTKLDAQRTTNQAAILTPYLAKLKQLESDLTKATRFDDAKEVMDYRQGLASGVPPQRTVTTAPPPTVTSTPPAPVSPAAPLPAGGFTNTLGMKFAPVPNTKVLFCIHPVTVKHYSAYASENPGISSDWKKQTIEGIPVIDKDDHPVVGVSWPEAKDFCVWLSKKEGRTYRLPTDREWSFAVGIGEKEKITEATLPESLSGKIHDVFPWGTKWPPPKGAGNYADTSCKEQFSKIGGISGYTDGFPITSPVMSFSANRHGLYDLSGNVFQWCEDWAGNPQKERVLRGGSWNNAERDVLLSSYRRPASPSVHKAHVGFRVVVESSR